VDLVFLGAGLPLHFPKSIDARTLRESPTLFVPIVSAARATRLIFKYWEKNFPRIPDAVVVEGPLAGGHLGFKRHQIDDPAFRLENIVPEVLQVVREYEEKHDKEIPVIPAGGIYTGSDIRKYLEMGASGVQMATRFVATHECDASEEFKQSYINARKEDIIIIESPVGLPGRAIRNRFLDEVAQGIRRPFRCPWKCLKTCDYTKSPYCIAHALANAQKGRLLSGFTFAGANAYRVDRIVSVKELFQQLETEYAESFIEAIPA
jgi:NAD(P)H-dependent flavin oxidoreductase YrpB (nitropropane dioxygenase family)